MGDKAKKQNAASRKNLTKTQEVLYGHEFKKADRAGANRPTL